MSYCRWSSANWSSDLYCYESAQGYTTHIADKRFVGPVPRVPNVGSVSFDDWFVAHKHQAQYLDTAQRLPIDLPFAGETFVDDTLEASLKLLGYNVPDHLLSDIQAEIADSANLEESANSQLLEAPHTPSSGAPTEASPARLAQLLKAVNLGDPPPPAPP